MKSYPLFLQRSCLLAGLSLSLISFSQENEVAIEPDASAAETAPTEASPQERLQALEYDLNQQLDVQAESGRNMHRFRLQAQALFNVHLDVTNGQSTAPSLSSAAARQFSNGFIGPDATPGDSLNSDWVYVNASQYDSVNNYMLFDSKMAGSSGQLRNSTDDPHLGVELAYGLELAKVWGGYAGLEFGFGYSDVEIGGINSQRQTDAYLLAAGAPPAPGVTGSGISIVDNAIRGTTTSVVNWESSIYALRFGPYIEWPFAKRFSAGVSGGPVLAFSDNRAKINESTAYGAFSGVRVQDTTVSSSEFGVGLYTDLRLGFEVSDAIQLFAGARYQYLESVSLTSGMVNAELKLNAAAMPYFGVGFSF